MTTLKNVRFAYRANGKGYSVTTDSSAENKRIKLDIEQTEEILTVKVKTRSPIEIVKLSAELEYDFSPDDRIFLNGYQSWTDSIEHGVNDKLRGISHIPSVISDKYAFSQYGDYGFIKYGRRNGTMHGFSYGYIRHTLGELDFFGSLNENDGFTIIKTDTSGSLLIVEKDCAGLEITEEYAGISLYIGKGSDDEVFDRYFELMDIKPPEAKPVFGYTSWYRHYQDINETKISDDLEGLISSEHNADVFQIDDGYQTAVGDWLSIDAAKFPDSMKAAADRIKDAGMTAGIWIAPFVCETNSTLFNEHKDWLLTDENGTPVRAGSNWSGSYALDIYNENVRAYLKEVFDTVVNEWGFGLLKLDFLYAACILPRKDKTRGRIMADGMALLRELAGSAKILGCGVPLASAFGMVDYCRIGCDVSLDWDDKAYMQLMHRERPSTKNSLLNSVFRRQLSGRAFINDPDVFLLRDNNTSMSAEQKSCLMTVNALTGGVLFTSDDFAGYGDGQKKMLTELFLLRDAKIKRARLQNNTLSLAVEKDGISDILCFKI